MVVTPAHRARIDRALSLVAGNARPHRTLTELTTQLQHAELLAALRPYTLAGQYGQLLDAAQDDLGESPFTVFELKHLLALDDRVVLPVLLYLFRRIEQRLDGGPTLIEIDEAWMALLHSTVRCPRSLSGCSPCASRTRPSCWRPRVRRSSPSSRLGTP